MFSLQALIDNDKYCHLSVTQLKFQKERISSVQPNRFKFKHKSCMNLGRVLWQLSFTQSRVSVATVMLNLSTHLSTHSTSQLRVKTSFSHLTRKGQMKVFSYRILTPTLLLATNNMVQNMCKKNSLKNCAELAQNRLLHQTGIRLQNVIASSYHSLMQTKFWHMRACMRMLHVISR